MHAVLRIILLKPTNESVHYVSMFILTYKNPNHNVKT